MRRLAGGLAEGDVAMRGLLEELGLECTERVTVTTVHASFDVEALAELLHRVSAMVEDMPEIAELDLNPVFVRQHGAVVADVRVRLTG